MTDVEMLTRLEEQAVVIAELKKSNEYLSGQLQRLPNEIRDRVIDQMRKTAVNCGQSSSCSVAGWCKKSTE